MIRWYLLALLVAAVVVAGILGLALRLPHPWGLVPIAVFGVVAIVIALWGAE